MKLIINTYGAAITVKKDVIVSFTNLYSVRLKPLLKAAMFVNITFYSYLDDCLHNGKDQNSQISANEAAQSVHLNSTYEIFQIHVSMVLLPNARYLKFL